MPARTSRATAIPEAVGSLYRLGVKDDVRSPVTYLVHEGSEETSAVLSTRTISDVVRYYLVVRSGEDRCGAVDFPKGGSVEIRAQVELEFANLLSKVDSAWLLLARLWEADPQNHILAVANEM